MIPRYYHMASLALLGLFVLGCSEGRASAQSSTGPPPVDALTTQGAASSSGPTKQELVIIDQKFDAVSGQYFSAILPQVVEKVGPGATDGNIFLGKGVLFSSIPVNRLAEDEAPGTIVGQGIEALTNKGDIRKIYPIDHKQRVVSFMMMRMNLKDGEPVAEKFNPRSSNLLAKEIEYARGVHSKATGTPLDAYKGVSFFGVNKHFLYYVDKDGKQEMVPLEHDPSLGLVPGEGVPAEEAFSKLKQLVKKRAKVEVPG